MGRRHGPDQARGLIGGRPERRVRRGDDDVEQAQLLCGHIHRPVGSDVGLDSFQQSEPALLRFVDAIDLAVLLDCLRHRHAARDREAI